MTRHTKTDYPIGATWEGIEKETGKIGTIWLESRHPFTKREVWRWECHYSDGSRPAHASDWGASYRMCREDLNINCRMRRIK